MFKKIIIFIGTILFWLTWGICDTIYGCIAFICMSPWIREIHMKGNNIVVRVKMNTGGGWGLEGGCFVFSNCDSIFDESYLLYHEWGHNNPQELIFGPLHPFICTIPSVIRFWYRDYKESKGIKLETGYDDFWVERTATNWGTKYFVRMSNKDLFLFNYRKKQ